MIKVDFSGLADPKVTAERIGEYKWTRGSGSGAFSVGVDTTNNYSLDAMREGYQHNRLTVAGGSTGQVFILQTRSYATLHVLIAADEEYRNLHGANWQTQAENKLRLAEPWFKEEHSIQFNVVGFTTAWTSQAALANDCTPFASDMVSDTNWPTTNPNNADIMFGITGENITGVGCATNTTPGSHAHPSALVQNSYTPADTLVMHELTHLYDYDHQCDSDDWYDIIESTISGGSCSGDSSFRLKNWRPAGDDVMASNRNWY
ncbi:MAG: M12 family metallo-peptidase [Nitrososphaera sp.]